MSLNSTVLSNCLNLNFLEFIEHLAASDIWYLDMIYLILDFKGQVWIDSWEDISFIYSQTSTIQEKAYLKHQGQQHGHPLSLKQCESYSSPGNFHLLVCMRQESNRGVVLDLLLSKSIHYQW